MATKWATGIWKSRALKDLSRHKWGKSDNGNPQLGIVVNVLQPKGTAREGVVYLTFTPDSKDFSIKRLRQLGWQGTDLKNLVGIDRNYVEVDVSYEVFNKEERLRLEILTPAEPRHKNELSERELDDLAYTLSDAAAKVPEVTLAKPKNARGDESPPDDEEPGGAFSDMA